MTNFTIESGQIYRPCSGSGPRIRITAYTPGATRAEVVDAQTGTNARKIPVSKLHESPITANGRRRNAGYTLERNRWTLAGLSHGNEETPR